jgi:hypothetical protein
MIALLVLCYSGYLKPSPFLNWLPLDLTLLSALIVLCAVITKGASGRNPARGSTAVVVLWCAWLPGVVISVLGDFDRYKVLLLFTVTLLCAFSPFLLVGDVRSQRYWINGHVACAAVFAVALILFPSDDLSDVYADRLNIDGGNTISAARLVGAGVLIAFLRALMAKRVRSRAIWWMLTVAGSVVVAAIGSRGPFLALLVAGLGAVLLSIVFIGRRLRSWRGRSSRWRAWCTTSTTRALSQ